ncbi:MAG: hypothetical protein K2F81_04055, partial [Ruminococcus sp.]|nr:hypothetical protein [Ruminococcus sp.]
MYNDNDKFQFQFTGDKISVIQGRMYEIENSEEITNWYCGHNIDSFNQTVVTTHPDISKCTKGRDYKYNYYIYQKNPQIDTNKITGTFIFEEAKYVNRGTSDNRILYIDASCFRGFDAKKYADGLTGATITLSQKNRPNKALFSTVYGYMPQNPKNNSSDTDKYNFIYMDNPNNFGNGFNNTSSLFGFDTYEIQLNPYAPFCDIYMGCGTTQGRSEALDSNKSDYTDIYAPIRNPLNEIQSQITMTFNKQNYVVGIMYIEIGGIRRRILNYDEKYISEQENGSVIHLHYDGWFGKDHMNKYKNANGDVPFKIYCNYIKTPWYDFKYRSAPSTGNLETNLSSSGLQCSTTYNQAENVSLKSYEYEVYSNEEEIIIDITDEQSIEIQSLLYGKISIKLPISLNEYDNILNGNIDLYANGVLSSSAPISSYDRVTNTVITEKRTSMTVDELKTSITKIIIELNQKYLYTSGTKYSYDLTHNFQIPAATSDYLIRRKITTQENDTINSTTSVYCNPDKIPDEYIVDTENDIRCLPTITKRGSAPWAAIM